MKTTSLEKADIAKRIKDKIKKEISNIIPMATVEKLIMETQEAFLKTELPGMIKEDLRKRFRELITAQLNRKWTDSYYIAEQERNTNEEIEKIIREAAPAILATLISEPARQLLSQLRSNVNSY